MDTPEDLDDMLIELYSPIDEQESDTEVVEELPTIASKEVLRLLQSVKLGEMQAEDCNAEFIKWIERYEKVVKQRHFNSLKQAGIRSFFSAV